MTANAQQETLPDTADHAPPAATPARVTPAQRVNQALERQRDRFAAVMPQGLDPDRFRNLVLSAVKSTPQLIECFSTREGEISLLMAAMNAATVGLEPNTPLGHAWLQPRRNGGRMECQLQIGYKGYQKLARRSGVRAIFAEVVREGDFFEWRRGLAEDHLEFRPLDGGDPDRPITHAFAVARYPDGAYAFVVLSAADIEKRRAMSESWRNEKARPYSPWTKWPAEMAKKTAIRVLCTTQLDLSTQAELAMIADERTVIVNDDGVIVDSDTGEVLEVEEADN